MAQAHGAVDVSDVCKLTRAAQKQYFVKHDARAVELYERAIATAEALRQPDCLIVARLRVSCLGSQHRNVCAAQSGDHSADAKRRGGAQVLALFQAHLPGVLETLERRRAAGTLLPMCCRAHEIAWEADCLRTELRLLGEPEPDAERLSQGAQLIGVQAYFAAARHAIFVSGISQDLGVMPEPLFGRCLTVLEHALLLTLGRKSDSGELNAAWIPPIEQVFLDAFRRILLPLLKPEKPCDARLLDAWRSVEQSGLLQVMQVEQACERCGRISKSFGDAQAARDAGVPLRACALPSCGAREAHVSHFKRCGACGQVVYCSKAHQAEHWPAHKAACKAARQAARQAAAEGGASQDT